MLKSSMLGSKVLIFLFCVRLGIHPKDKQLDHPTDKEQKRQDSQDDHKTCDGNFILLKHI